MPAANFIETFMAEAFEPMRPDPSKILISDIAHALSHICRFNGHTREFYSVAEHSVRVSWLLQDLEESKRVQLWGLLHDASEAYLCDVPSPLKALPTFEAYRVAEGVVQGAVCERFGITKKMPDAVARADRALLATEARDLMPFVPEHWGGIEVEALVERITPWQPTEAKRKFMRRFCELYGRE